MSKERYRVIPRTLCIIKNNDKVLLIKYSDTKGKMEGFYNLPGGHIEDGEGIIENAQREILEETGLRPGITKLVGVVHIENFFDKKVMMFVTVSESLSADVVANEEGELFWMNREEIEKIPIFEDVKIILDRVNDSAEVFTAKSSFGNNGNMKYFKFEK